MVPMSAGAQEHHMPAMGPAVAIGYNTYDPPHLDVLVGEPVTWTNESVRKHTVTADDMSFDSGTLFGSDHYTRAFTAPGQVGYHCELHAGMAGTVGVHELLLDAPRQEAAPGRAFPVVGRAALPAGTDVTIEASTGAGFVAVAWATVGLDRSFTTTVRPATSGQMRAVAGGATSPVVGLRVLDHQVAFGVRRSARGLVLTARVTPADPGGTVVLQLDQREHFGWWPTRTLRLDGRSQARTVLPLAERVRARMVLTLADGATPLAISSLRTIGPARAARR
jgi:plastocyanin